MQLEDMFKSAEESLKMPIWKYNDKCNLKVNDKHVTDYAVGKYKTDGDIEIINSTKIYALHIRFNILQICI